MSYSSTRDTEQLRWLGTRIDQFVQRYQTANIAPGDRHTLILFVGGMGAQLWRTTSSYQDNGGPNQTFQYDQVWLTPATLLHDALLLKMHTLPSGEDRDLDDRIIVAHDAVEFLGCGPYDLFTNWCEQQNIDWFIYGWDWRRPLDRIAQFFVERFLPLSRTLFCSSAARIPSKTWFW